MKVVKITPSDCSEPVVVISHYQNVVSSVASISLPLILVVTFTISFLQCYSINSPMHNL